MFVVVLGAAPAHRQRPHHRRRPHPADPAAGRAGARRPGLAAYRHVVLPAALPSFIGGLKQGWAFPWRSLMAGELIAVIPGEPSIGFLLQLNRELADSAGADRDDDRHPRHRHRRRLAGLRDARPRDPAPLGPARPRHLIGGLRLTGSGSAH